MPSQANSENLDLTLGRLTDDQLRNDYLPLRFSTIHREMRWVKEAPTTALDLRDEYDDLACPLGVYVGERLVAAVRLISAENSRDLPSAPFIPTLNFSSGTAAEISKAMVDPAWRGRGLFTALLLRCQIEALKRAIAHIFISVLDSTKVRTFLSTEGFDVVGAPFHFVDAKIAPEANAIVLHKQMHNAFGLEKRVRSLLTNIADEIGTQQAMPIEIKIG